MTPNDCHDCRRLAKQALAVGVNLARINTPTGHLSNCPVPGQLAKEIDPNQPWAGYWPKANYTPDAEAGARHLSQYEEALSQPPLPPVPRSGATYHSPLARSEASPAQLYERAKRTNHSVPHTPQRATVRQEPRTIRVVRGKSSGIHWTKQHSTLVLLCFLAALIFLCFVLPVLIGMASYAAGI